MSTRIRLALAAAVVAVLPLAACGGGDDPNKITIGTKFDQPGLGMKTPQGMRGFDVDVATYVAQQLGYKPDQIEWKEAPTPQRENLIDTGQVDYIVATYSITDARKEKVSFAGPYFTTGQGLLVRADDTSITGPESLNNNKVLCSVNNSTPAQNIKKKYPKVQLQEYDTYSACIEALRNRAVDALTTDAVILAGYSEQSPGQFKIAGQPFTVENYGIGLAKDDTELRGKINDAIQKMIDEGAWQQAFQKNLGQSGYQMPPPPQVQRY